MPGLSQTHLTRPAFAEVRWPISPNRPAPPRGPPSGSGEPRGGKGPGRKRHQDDTSASDAAPSKAAAKAKVAAGKAKAAPNPPSKGWDASRCKTMGDKEACVRFAVGKCTKTDCRFVPGSPVPLPNGKACGQPHTALEHGKTPH